MSEAFHLSSATVNLGIASLLNMHVKQDRNRELAIRRAHIVQHLAKNSGVDTEGSQMRSSDVGVIPLVPVSMLMGGYGESVLPASSGTGPPGGEIGCTAMGSCFGIEVGHEVESSIPKQQVRHHVQHIIADINYKHVFSKAAVPMAIANTDGTYCSGLHDEVWG